MPAVLDTHAAVWYLLDSTKLSESVYSLIDGAAASGTPTYNWFLWCSAITKSNARSIASVSVPAPNTFCASVIFARPNRKHL